jgi:hypothetical protein
LTDRYRGTRNVVVFHIGAHDAIDEGSKLSGRDVVIYCEARAATVSKRSSGNLRRRRGDKGCIQQLSLTTAL